MPPSLHERKRCMLVSLQTIVALVSSNQEHFTIRIHQIGARFNRSLRRSIHTCVPDKHTVSVLAQPIQCLACASVTLNRGGLQRRRLYCSAAPGPVASVLDSNRDVVMAAVKAGWLRYTSR